MKWHSTIPYPVSGLTLDHKGILWIANNNNGACAYDFGTQNCQYTSIRVPMSTASVATVSIPSMKTVRIDYGSVLMKMDWIYTRRETDDFENFDMSKKRLGK